MTLSSSPSCPAPQMVRKSVETRDWLNTIEPRNVRSVMKRIVEEVTLIDKQVGSLYKEGSRKEQGSGGCGDWRGCGRGSGYIALCGVVQRVREAGTLITTV